MTAIKFDKEEIREAFNNAADQYDTHAVLQQSIAWEVFERARQQFPQGAKILDIGCGTGYIAALAEREEVGWNLLQMDISSSMCRKARAYAPVLCADADTLPFKEAVFDGIVSSLTVQWLDEALRCFAGIYHAMKPGSQFHISTLGPYTLVELREAFASVDEYSRVSDFVAREVLEMWVESVGFEDVKSESQISMTMYPDVMSLQNTLRGIGASNKLVERKKTFTPRSVFAHMETAYREQYGVGDGIPASWEIIYLTGTKP